MNPGDVYVFDLPTDVSAFWLVVREHPDGGPFLLVPCEQSPFTGGRDVPLPSACGPTQATMYARCGLSVWCESADLGRCRPIKLGQAVTAEELAAVRQMLADLARGRAVPDSRDDNDPNYWELCGELERLGLHLSGGRV